MTIRDDIEAGRKKFRDDQNKARGRTRTIQRRQNPNRFLLWIGENIERILPARNGEQKGVKSYLALVKEDIEYLLVKLHVKREPVSEAWDRAVQRMKGRGL